MHNQTQNVITYLESENTPTVNLSAFKSKEKRKRIVKDLSHAAEKVKQIKQVTKSEPTPVIENVPTEPVVDGNIERRVRPLNLSFIKKKEKNVTWL